MAKRAFQPGEGNRWIINFHGVGKQHADVEKDEAIFWCETDLFLKLLDSIAALKDKGEAIDITFDDGNLSDFEIAKPALVERGLVAEFFVCSGRIGKRHYLGPDEIREMVAMGMGIGSHGQNHVDLRQVSEADLRTETGSARDTLEACCGHPVNSFAIPFGSYNRRVVNALKQYQRVYSSDTGRARGNERLLPRIAYRLDWTEATPQALVARADSQLGYMRNRFKSLVKRMR